MRPAALLPTIRRARAEDAAALARVHVDAWRAAYRGLVPDSFLNGLDYERRVVRFREQLEAGLGEVSVAEREGQVLGFVVLDGCRDEDVDPQTTGELWGIYLAPQHWRQGVGTLLYHYAEQALIARGYGEIKLWVLAGNSAARRFYETMGFATDGASRMLNFDAPLEAVRYAKQVDVTKREVTEKLETGLKDR